MKKLLTSCLVMLTIFAALYARGATPDPKSAPAAVAPATVDPKVTELQGKVDALTAQLDQAVKGMSLIQQQRNKVASDLMDAQANIQLFQNLLGERDAQIAELKKKADGRPPEPVAPAPSSASADGKK